MMRSPERRTSWRYACRIWAIVSPSRSVKMRMVSIGVESIALSYEVKPLVKWSEARRLTHEGLSRSLLIAIHGGEVPIVDAV